MSFYKKNITYLLTYLLTCLLTYLYFTYLLTYLLISLREIHIFHINRATVLSCVFVMGDRT